MWPFGMSRKQQLTALAKVFGLEGQNLEKALTIAAKAETKRRETEREIFSYSDATTGEQAITAGLRRSMKSNWENAQREIRDLAQDKSLENSL